MTDAAPEGAPAIAVTGLAARFPGADDVAQFWRNLLDGLPADQAAAVDPAEFDADFFGIAPAEAARMDPQHRMFLECCWHALEAAGYDPGHVPPRVGALFAGCSFPAYLVLSLLTDPGLAAGPDALALALANQADVLAARAAYHLDLRGPCLTVQAFSASGLIAVHLAAQSLLLGECDLAIAGAASIRLRELPEGPMPTSRSGVCAPLDARADGLLTGNGAGVVVLRRLDDALADGDHVHAVLAGTAVTHDGGRSHGFGVPTSDAKAEAMAEALAVAGLGPEDLGYLEAQAMGDPVSDALEIAALDQVFGGAPPGTACRLGAVAGNVGHLDAAAGMAGLIKAILMVERGWIPPQPGFRTPAAALARARTRFEVATEGRPWPAPGGAGQPPPRRCGVNSFGSGGSNAHAVVSQPPAPPVTAPDPGLQLFVLSARDEQALRQVAAIIHGALTASWAALWEGPPLEDGPVAATPSGFAAGGPSSPADVAFTLQTGRVSLACRVAFIAAGPTALLHGLHRIATGEHRPGELAGTGPAAAAWTQLARQWLVGEEPDWAAAHAGAPRRRVPLPGYPFERHRFWTGPGGGDGRAANGQQIPGPIRAPDGDTSRRGRA